MCGIAGILRLTPPSRSADALTRPLADVIPEPWLDLLDEHIRHRGPDGQGRFRDRAVRPDGVIADVALVHRRLSIIDPAGGAQPMLAPASPVSPFSRAPSASSGSSVSPLLFQGAATAPVSYSPLPAAPHLATVFNGCIYNHRELRAELAAAGRVFTTDHSDTEVLLQGWNQWFGELPAHLVGMYAAAIWDASLGALLITRDPFGEKPLYTLDLRFDDSTWTFFSSTAAGLLALRLKHQLQTRAHVGGALSRPLKKFIRLGYARGLRPWVDEHTPEMLSSTPLAHSSREPLSVNFTRPRWLYPRFTAPPTAPNTIAGTLTPTHAPPLTLDTLDHLLDGAVTRRLEADVPLGCFLSGGVDSSLIAHYAQCAIAAKSRGARLSTFTVRMPDPRYDESVFAQKVADILGTDHHTLDVSPTPADDLVHLIRQLGLPFADSSLLPAYWLSRESRKHVRVALSGDGGDELFYGYERYVAAGWLERLAPILRHLPELDLPAARPRSMATRLRRFLNAARVNPYELSAIFEYPDFNRLTNAPPLRKGRKGDGLSTAPEKLRRADLADYLPFDLLRKTDTASMAVALEVRTPFLDPDLALAAWATPVATLMPKGRRKGLLRALARRFFPAAIVDRRKMGFAIPIGEWFRSDFGGMKTLLLDHLHSREPFGPRELLGLELDLAYIRQLVDEHMENRRDHSQRLYALLVLSIWAKWMEKHAATSTHVP